MAGVKRMLPWLCGWVVWMHAHSAAGLPDRPVATYSIVGFDPGTGDLGVAVQSKFFGVGSVVPFAKAGVGAIATQAYGNTTYGPRGLDLLSRGFSAEGAVSELTRGDEHKDFRQLGIVDARGRSAAHTGAKCGPWAGNVVGQHFTVQGNILAGEEVARAMAAAFEAAREVPDSELADWLMTALEAGELAGGDKRGRQSAALLVVRAKGGYAGLNDRYVDLRVEDHPEPIRELQRLLELHKKFFVQEHARKPEPPKLEDFRKTEDGGDQRRWGWPVYLLMLIGVGAVFMISTKSPDAPTLGVQGGRLTPCSGRPNAVSSQAVESELHVAPLRLEGGVVEAKAILLEAALKLPRTTLYTEGETYLRFESRSPILRFVDDLEFYFDTEEKLIHVRSGARCGYWDMGVNRRRVQSLYALLPMTMTADPRPLK
jgi:uncharacterized Ntn-hydrolase superfamily protein/uncharacterized protein (DUF1499 family)